MGWGVFTLHFIPPFPYSLYISVMARALILYRKWLRFGKNRYRFLYEDLHIPLGIGNSYLGRGFTFPCKTNKEMRHAVFTNRTPITYLNLPYGIPIVTSCYVTAVRSFDNLKCNGVLESKDFLIDVKKLSRKMSCILSCFTELLRVSSGAAVSSLFTPMLFDRFYENLRRIELSLNFWRIYK